jgi:hypothetical protein
MHFHKPIFVLLILSAFAFKSQNYKPNIIRWVITKGCSLNVGGSTTINKFNCVIPEYNRPDTLTLHKNANLIILSGCIKLDVNNFDCHNSIMTKDLRKTLKVEEFPNLNIHFLSLSKYPLQGKNNGIIKGAVNIELAGVTKRYDVDYKFIMNGKNCLTMVGTRPINFSDFNIVPPRKIGGLIKTHNELNVEFTLNVKILD